MQTGYKLIIFDWDGTLSDSIGQIIENLKLAVQEFNLSEFDEYFARRLIGLDMVSMLSQLYPELNARVLFEIHDRYRYYNAKNIDNVYLFSGVREVLEKLSSKGYFLSIATGKGTSGLRLALEKAQIANYFTTTRCADMTASKPCPQMVLEIIEHCGVLTGDTLLIGDSLYDIELATNAAVDSLAIASNFYTDEELLAKGALAVIRDLSEIFEYL